MKKKILFALLSFTIAITNVPVVSYALEDSKQSITENGITSSKEAEKDLFEEETGSIYEKNADLSEEEMESQDVEADDSLTDESDTIDGEKEDSFEDEKTEQRPDISSQQPEEPVIPEDEEDDTTDFGEAGFVEDEQGVRYYTEDGQIAVGEQIIDGFCYIFDENGYLKLGLQENSQGEKLYYIAEQPYLLVSSTQKIADDWYYFDESGVMFHSGWRYDNSNTYYYNDDGTLVRGFFELDGNTYYFENNGNMATGSKK